MALCLILAMLTIGIYFLILDKSQFFDFRSASLSFDLKNESSKTLDASFFLYGGVGRLEFNGTNWSILQGNLSIWEISDKSGIEVACYDLAPSGHLSFIVEQIKTTPLLRNIKDIDLKLSFSQGNDSVFSYSGVISLLNDEGISITSRDYQMVRLNQNASYLRYEDRTTSQIHLNVLVATATAFSIGAVAMLAWNRARMFPIISVFILLITLFLYLFVGSGFEINGRYWWWLFPISIFIHGSDWHIVGNLVHFVMMSVLFESFLKARNQWMKRDMAIWYAIPLFLPLVFSTPSLITGRQFSFGLSFSIEIMTWTLWAYIASHCHKLVRSRISLLMSILSGIPSYVFLGWVISYSFGFAGDPYDNSLAIWHIAVGGISGIGVLLIVFGREIRNELKKVRDHMPLWLNSAR